MRPRLPLAWLIAAAILAAGGARAQTPPGWTYNQVPTTAQWNAAFAGKQDYLGAPPLLRTGGAMSGRLVTAASTASAAGLNLPTGAAPTSPTDGDLWTTTAGMFVRINGSTVGPLGTCPTCATLGANTFTGTQTINPATGTINQGLAINQTFPASGTSPGPVLGNTITITNPGVTSSTTGIDAFGQIKQQVVGFRINYAAAGTGTNNGALGAAMWVTGQTDAYGAAVGSATATNISGHDLWGVIGYGTLYTGGAVNALIGVESEVGIQAGATAGYRIAVGANSQGPGKGSVLDAAFAASMINQVGTAAPFEHLIALTTNLYGTAFPISATGDLLFSDASGTIANGINLSNVAVTGNILSFPNMAIGGNGTAVFGAGSGSLPGVGVNASCASCGSVLVAGVTNSGNNGDGVTIKDVSTNNVMFVGVQEPSSTNVRFGQTIANWGEFVTLGSANLGQLIGTITDKPVIIGTFNVARLTITSASVTSSVQQVVSLNAGALPAAITGTALRAAQSDGTTARIVAEGYGAIAALTVARADNTATAPSQVLSGEQIGGFNAYAWGSNAAWNGPIASIRSYAGENITATAWGSKLCFATTPVTTAAIADGFCQNPTSGVTLGAPTGGDKGAGTLNAAGTIYVNNVAVLVTGASIDAATLTGTVASARMTGSYTGITGVGTLTAGATGSGFTVALATSTVSGALPCANHPALTGDVTTTAGSCATTLASGSASNLNSGTLATARGGVNLSSWTSYLGSCTATAQTPGITPPTLTSNTCDYWLNGKTVTARVTLTVTAQGTGTGALKIPLPFAAAAVQYGGSAAEFSAVGIGGYCYVTASATFMTCSSNVGGSPFIVTGQSIVAEIQYATP